jgi:adenylate cyclase
MERQTSAAPVREGLWYEVFALGHPVLLGKHRKYARLPLEPRCKLCKVPFRGVGWIMRSRGWRPSPRNEDYCSVCDLFIRDHEGVADVVMPILFTDLRDSTAAVSSLSNADYSRLRRVYRAEIAAALRRADGFVLEETGDQVVGVFPPGLTSTASSATTDDARVSLAARLALACARDLGANTIKRVRQATGLSFGVAFHLGDVRVAAAFRPDGTGAAVEINGAPVNVSARLASAAAPGEIFVTETLRSAAATDMSGHEQRTFPAGALKGVVEPVRVSVLRAS